MLTESNILTDLLDIMGAVSDEDILKLTKLTAEVEIRQLKGHHSRSRMDKGLFVCVFSYLFVWICYCLIICNCPCSSIRSRG
jgi:uncharacterized membrane protein YbhN (UPF0104 family)